MYVYNVTHQHSLPYMDVVRSHLMIVITRITKIITQVMMKMIIIMMIMIIIMLIIYGLNMTLSALVRKRRLIWQSYAGNYPKIILRRQLS